MHEIQQYREAVSSIKQASLHKWDKYELRDKLKADLYRRQGADANNFLQTLPVQQALKAVGMFKDEYLLDFINVEEMRQLLMENPEIE